MSGIEVVGLVLGGLPLIISGLEHYSEGIRSIKTIRNAAGEYVSMRRKLVGENVLFRNTLEILLQDAVDAEVQKRLLDNVGGIAWQDAAIEDALRERLQSSYSSYVEHVVHIQHAIAEFRKRLEINEQGKGPFDDSKTFKKAIKRVGFALHKTEYLELINEIKADNIHLHHLTGQSQTLHNAEVGRSRPDFGRIRTNAANLFSNLQRALHVTCKAAHRASICLSSLHGANTRNGEVTSDIRVILQHEPQAVEGATLWTLEETEVRLVQLAIASDLAKETHGKAGEQKAVKFQEVVIRGTTNDEAVNADQQAALSEIADLCVKLQLYGMVNGEPA